jgi:hypothetical protein
MLNLLAAIVDDPDTDAAAALVRAIVREANLSFGSLCMVERGADGQISEVLPVAAVGWGPDYFALRHRPTEGKTAYVVLHNNVLRADYRSSDCPAFSYLDSRYSQWESLGSGAIAQFLEESKCARLLPPRVTAKVFYGFPLKVVVAGKHQCLGCLKLLVVDSERDISHDFVVEVAKSISGLARLQVSLLDRRVSTEVRKLYVKKERFEDEDATPYDVGVEPGPASKEKTTVYLDAELTRSVALTKGQLALLRVFAQQSVQRVVHPTVEQRIRNFLKIVRDLDVRVSRPHGGGKGWQFSPFQLMVV